MVKRKQEIDPLILDMKSVLTSPNGRRVIWHILGLCNLYSTPAIEVNNMLFEAGKRSIGLDILGILEDVDPSEYPKLCLELGAKTYEREPDSIDPE